MKNNVALGLILGFFILVIVGVTFMSEVADLNQQQTTIYFANETITTSSGTASTTNEDGQSCSYFGNDTLDASAHIGTLINCTHSNDAVTTITVTETNYSDGSYYVGLNYYPDGYVKDSGGRAMTRLIPLIFALAILAYGIYYFKKNYEGSVGKFT